MKIVDAAARVKVSERTVIRWIKSGRLRTTRVYRDDGRSWRHDIRLDDLIDAADMEPAWWKPRCRNGHEYTPENTAYELRAWTDRTYRRCLTCIEKRESA